MAYRIQFSRRSQVLKRDAAERAYWEAEGLWVEPEPGVIQQHGGKMLGGIMSDCAPTVEAPSLHPAVLPTWLAESPGSSAIIARVWALSLTMSGSKGSCFGMSASRLPAA